MRPPDSVSLPDRRNYSNAVYSSTFNSRPMVGAAISAGSSLLGSLFSGFSANKQLKAQQEENRLNREFNSQEAQKNRDFQRQMFDAENAYNDPKAVVARLQAAGLNPALAFGGIADSASAMSGSTASSSGSVNPALPDWSGIGSAGQAFFQNELMQAQIEKTRAEAAKTNAEVPWVDRLSESLNRLQNSGVDVNISTKNMTDENAKVLTKSLDRMDEEISSLKTNNLISLQNLRQATSDANIREIEEKYADSIQNAKHNSLLANANLSTAQTVRVLALLGFEIKKMNSETRLNNANAKSIEFANMLNENNLKQFGLDALSAHQLDSLRANFKKLENTFKDGDSTYLDKFIDSFSTIINIIGGIFGTLPI